jgi:hypothetical protein
MVDALRAKDGQKDRVAACQPHPQPDDLVKQQAAAFTSYIRARQSVGGDRHQLNQCGCPCLQKLRPTRANTGRDGRREPSTSVSAFARLTAQLPA